MAGMGGSASRVGELAVTLTAHFRGRRRCNCDAGPRWYPGRRTLRTETFVVVVFGLSYLGIAFGTVPALRWPARPEPHVLEDSLDDRGVLDHGDQAQLAAAARAAPHVFPPHPAEQLGPRETASAGWVVRADEVGVGLVLGVLLMQINSGHGYHRYHPNPAGHAVIADLFWSAIEN
jgi:hypothetical protein